MSKFAILMLFGLVVVHQVRSECTSSDLQKVSDCLSKLGTVPTDESQVKKFCDDTVPKMKSCTKDAGDCAANDAIKAAVDVYEKACKEYNGAPSGFMVSGTLLTVSLVLQYLMK